MENVQTLEQIIASYPNEWVLIANPQMRGDDFVGPIIKKLIAGTVLYHSKDKREIAYKGLGLVSNHEETTCIFTGEIAKKRKFWL